jgi:hypothetical protein
VKIADFGLAKILGRPPGSFTLTDSHQVMGTPHYMAPEQMQGSHAVDHRADIYSLGVVFYEMLTGELPLGRFEPPSKRVEVDVRLDEVVLRTLEREPARRYQQASEVKTDVEMISSSHQSPSVARPESAKGVSSVAPSGPTPFADSGRATQSADSGRATWSPIEPAVLESARRAVRTPAAAWLLVAIATVLISASLAAWSGVTLARIAASPESPEQTKSDSGGVTSTVTRKPHPWRPHRDKFILLLIVQIAAVAAGGQMVLAAFCLRRLESPSLVRAGAVFTVIPLSPAWLIGLPIGTWIMSVLGRPDVKAAFEQPTPCGAETDDAGFGLNDWLKEPAGWGMLVCLIGVVVAFLPWQRMNIFGFSFDLLGIDGWAGLTTGSVCVVTLLVLAALNLFGGSRRWKAATMLVAGIVTGGVSGYVMIDAFRGPRAAQTSFSGDEVMRDLAKALSDIVVEGMGASLHVGAVTMPVLAFVLALLGLLELWQSRRP